MSGEHELPTWARQATPVVPPVLNTTEAIVPGKPWDLDSLLECVRSDLYPDQIRSLLREAYDAGQRRAEDIRAERDAVLYNKLLAVLDALDANEQP